LSGAVENPKRVVAHEAVNRYVEDGMVLGLGTGSTAYWVVRRIGELLAVGELRSVRGIPTSERTVALAKEFGVPLLTLSEARPDLTLDGADEVSRDLDVLKGWGGALLREKIVAASSRDGLVIVADGSKMVESVGKGPVPVEVEPFGWEATMDALASLGCDATLRTEDFDSDRPFVTDGGHYTVDCLFDAIPDPDALQTEIKRIPGVIETGLFLGIARAAVVGHADGVEVLRSHREGAL
jgi:ribose 5-phosphate isomerase A